MRVSICLIEPEGYKYSHFLYDSCKYLCYSIEANGHDCCMVRNKFYNDRVNIILGSHNIKDSSVAKQIERAGRYVIVQSELLTENGIAGWPNQSSFKNIYVPLMQRASAVWDGIELNKKCIENLGIQADFIPRFGYLPAMEEIVHKKRKDIDFLYYGSLTPHRKKRIDELKARGANVLCFFDEAAIFRNDYIARTRVHLSPVQGPGADQVPTRLLYLLNNRCVVVSEKFRNQDWLDQCFLSAETEQWADLCMKTIQRPDLDQLADQFFERYKQLDMTALFQPLLDKLSHTRDSISRSVSTGNAVDKLQRLVAESGKTTRDSAHIGSPESIVRLEALLKEQNSAAAIKTPTGMKDDGKPIGTANQSNKAFQLFGNKAIAGLTSIIIVTHNRLEQTKKCVKNIRKHTPEDHEIIFVDNHSTDGTAKWIQSQIRENKNYRLVEKTESASPSQARNTGIAEAQGEFVCLLANDVTVGEKWLSGMLACISKAPAAGIVGPMTNKADGPQQVIEEGYRSTDDFKKCAVQFKKQYASRRILCRTMAGFCMLFRHDLSEKVGFLDENFDADALWAEDFCLRAEMAGYKNYLAGDVFIHRQREDPRQVDRKIFQTKWALGMATPPGRKLAVLKATEMADSFYAKGQMDQAVEALVNCIKFSPNDPQIYYELTRLFLESKRFPEARDVVAAMPEAAKASLNGLECAGYSQEGLGLDDEAAASANEMLFLCKDYPAAINLLGVLSFKKADSEKAQKYFEQAVLADSGYGEAYTNLGVLLWKTERTEEAFDHLQTGFMLSPSVPDAGALYYSAVSSLNRFSEAEANFAEACRLYPQNKNLLFLYIDILIQQGKFEDAMLKIEDALDAFGLDDATMQAALSVREKIGPLRIEKPGQKGTLSLCMIVKNEEKYLVQCLKSVRDVVDEMIIVDTGSTDKTKDIARIFGAKLYDFPWTGDFSAARNESLAHATGDWVLILDADEVISPLDLNELKNLVRKKTSKPIAYSIVTRNYINNMSVIGWTQNKGDYPEEAGAGWVPSPKVRLAPRSKDVFFSNPVHELLEHSLKDRKIGVSPCKIVVHHYGKLDVVKDSRKGEDYYLLGKIKYEGDPNNVKYIFELAKQAHLLRKYEETVELWIKLLSLIENSPDSEDYKLIKRICIGDPIAEIYIQLAAAYLQMDRFESALAASTRAMATQQKLKEYVHVYAYSEVIAGSAEKALPPIDELLENMPDYLPALLVKLAALLLLGEKDKAGETIRQMKQKQASFSSHLNRCARQLNSNKRKDLAVRLLTAMVENKIDNKETHVLLDAFQKG